MHVCMYVCMYELCMYVYHLYTPIAKWHGIAALASLFLPFLPRPIFPPFPPLLRAHVDEL